MKIPMISAIQKKTIAQRIKRAASFEATAQSGAANAPVPRKKPLPLPESIYCPMKLQQTGLFDTLGCGHQFDTLFLAEHIKSQEHPACPLCRVPIPTPAPQTPENRTEILDNIPLAQRDMMISYIHDVPTRQIDLFIHKILKEDQTNNRPIRQFIFNELLPSMPSHPQLINDPNQENTVKIIRETNRILKAQCQKDIRTITEALKTHLQTQLIPRYFPRKSADLQRFDWMILRICEAIETRYPHQFQQKLAPLYRPLLEQGLAERFNKPKE